MTIDGDAAYQVLLAHDARFDGRLFVGVTSTGVYCRPICRVRMPARRNCRFFASPAQAEAASFRPCLKCRPEIAPGPGLAWTVMDASRTLARQAASALDEFAADGEAPSVAAIAERLGVSDRHLRRIFFAEHGVTPLQYLQTRRLLLAKQLLTDTQMPVAQIALTSGFRSLRRFNAAFLGGYRMNPTRLRRATATRRATGDGAARRHAAGAAGDAPTRSRSRSATAHRSTSTPLIAFIAQRAIPGIEVDRRPRSIRRSVRAGVVATSAGLDRGAFRDRRGARPPRVRAGARARRAAPSSPPCGAGSTSTRRPRRSPSRSSACRAKPGLRLPGSIDAFELAVRAVLGQQVTVAAARTLARRLVERFGADIATPWPDVDAHLPGPGRPRHRADRADRRARHHPQPRRRDPGARLALGCARAAALARRVARSAGRSPARAARHRPVDGALHRDARARLARRVPARRRRRLEGDAARCFATTTPRAAEAHAEAWRPWRAYALLRLWNSLGVTP